MATAQRPISLAAGQEKSTEPAWKTIPSWYLVGRQDQVFTAQAQRFMASAPPDDRDQLAHASYISRPGKVTKVILRAARSVG